MLWNLSELCVGNFELSKETRLLPSSLSSLVPDAAKERFIKRATRMRKNRRPIDTDQLSTACDTTPLVIAFISMVSLDSSILQTNAVL